MKNVYQLKPDKGSEICDITNFKVALSEAKRIAINSRVSVSIYRNGFFHYCVEFPYYMRNLPIDLSDLVCYSAM